MSENGNPMVEGTSEKSLEERIEALKNEVHEIEEAVGIKQKNVELLRRTIFEEYYEEIKKGGFSLFERANEDTIVRELRQLRIPIVVQNTVNSEEKCYSSLLSLLKDMISTVPRSPVKK